MNTLGRHKAPAPDADLLNVFWSAPNDAFLTAEVVAAAMNTTPLALAYKRWQKRGLPYYKPSKTPLYKKADVIAYIEEARHEPEE